MFKFFRKLGIIEWLVVLGLSFVCFKSAWPIPSKTESSDQVAQSVVVYGKDSGGTIHALNITNGKLQITVGAGNLSTGNITISNATDSSGLLTVFTKDTGFTNLTGAILTSPSDGYGSFLNPGGADGITVNGTTGLYSGSASYYLNYYSTGNVALAHGGGDVVVGKTNVGKMGIGVTSPTAALHLKASNTTAGTAPLKFTSGTSMTMPEAGAVEYDGTNLYFTPNATRKTVALASNNNILDTLRHLIFTHVNPSILYSTKSTWCLQNTPSNITVSNIKVAVDIDPTTEMNGDFKYADSCIGLENPVEIGSINTTAGLANNTVSVAVPGNKTLYISYTGAPDVAISGVTYDFTYNITQ